MDTDLDLPELVQCQDHLNVLRYIRLHQLREPELVLEAGKGLLGSALDRRISDELIRTTVLEQVCLAALDLSDTSLAELCLRRLKETGAVSPESARFRLLLARCLEANGDWAGADIIYDELLKENPANTKALKRKYCILKAQPGKQIETAEALHAYLQQNYSDAAAWYELAQWRSSMGDYKAAAFCLQEVLLATPTNAKIHCELAECYSTIGGDLDHHRLARQHMAQAIELDDTYVRAQFGLLVTANAYIEEAAKHRKKGSSEEEDEIDFQVQVALELVKYSAERLLQTYQGSEMLQSVKKLTQEYLEDL
jgi:tetratricopeptide (TPR) repeat protein